MKIRILVVASLLAFFPLLSFAQAAGSVSKGNATAPAAASPRFEAAHVDRNVRVPIPMQSGPTREGDRYVIYALSMQALISNAYDIPENRVIGGPPWLEFDRYDIEAKALATTSDADLKLMLKSLLDERFHLTVRNDTVPQPVRILYLEKGSSKLKASDGKEDAGCKGQPPAPGGPPMNNIDCHGQTMEDLARLLQNIAGTLDKRPVIDKTGLKGGYDYKLSWTPDFARAMAGADGVSLTDALSKELGLKIVDETLPRPALMVESANEEPAPDPPETAKNMPPRPLPQFDVTVIKPFQPGSPMRYMMGNGRLEVNGITLKMLINMAWELNSGNNSAIVNAPAWLDTDRWNIVAKTSSDEAVNPKKPTQIDLQQFNLMIRALLTERFHLQAHMEEREGDAYDLVAVNPKLLTPADPNLPAYDPRRRETCITSPGPGAIDPRIKNPILDRLFYCSNGTIEHLAHQLQSNPGGGIHEMVFDKTGLKGRYNYTLSYSSSFNSPGNGPPPGAANGSPSASEPNGAVSMSEALRRDLGLKLVKVKAPVPALVIDHIDETPTPN
jgi:uncharacterized protein (TIGR03435 family)